MAAAVSSSIANMAHQRGWRVGRGQAADIGTGGVITETAIRVHISDVCQAPHRPQKKRPINRDEAASLGEEDSQRGLSAEKSLIVECARIS
jgi:hypothetical protein